MAGFIDRSSALTAVANAGAIGEDRTALEMVGALPTYHFGVAVITEAKARKVLGDWIKPGQVLDVLDTRYLNWHPTHDDGAGLDGRFTADELEAIAWWMRHHALVKA